jgi:putative glutamine amidotransferase
VLIPRDSLLGSILLADPVAAAEATPSTAGSTPEGCLRLPVNTSHHQSVALCGEQLRIVARCPDDEVIEAIELRDSTMFHVEHPRRRFLLGVQWHPERSLEISAASRALFHRLIAEAEAFASQR